MQGDWIKMGSKLGDVIVSLILAIEMALLKLSLRRSK